MTKNLGLRKKFRLEYPFQPDKKKEMGLHFSSPAKIELLVTVQGEEHKILCLRHKLAHNEHKILIPIST